MGRLVDGVWKDEWYDTARTEGRFEREDAKFEWGIKPPAEGQTSEAARQASLKEQTPFIAEAGRYHLYVSLACPWAHRTIIFRQLKELEPLIGMTVVHPHMLENGWEFDDAKDPLYGFSCLHEIYTRAVPDYSGRVTVPVLWDKQTETIVNNESAQIIRIFNSAFNSLTGNDDDYYPAALRAEIDAINDRVYHTVNNGVYKAGFATAQAPYEEAFAALFDTLDFLEDRLAGQRFLVGGQMTEADIRLFTTLIRFDAVYHGHFKTNLRRIADYPNLSGYVRDIYQTGAIASTVDIGQIKQHYYVSQTKVNPTQIVPLGPTLDFTRPYDRAKLG